MAVLQIDAEKFVLDLIGIFHKRAGPSCGHELLHAYGRNGGQALVGFFYVTKESFMRADSSFGINLLA